MKKKLLLLTVSAIVGLSACKKAALLQEEVVNSKKTMSGASVQSLFLMSPKKLMRQLRETA
jgi:hypothetical protein